MRFVFYVHSLVSDWNHGNAHFLRGVMRALLRRGHEAVAMEPAAGWSLTNLLADQGEEAVRRFALDFPELRTIAYEDGAAHERYVEGADVVVVHEWTDPRIIGELGALRRRGGRFLLLFHDTHHRAVSESASIESLPLDDFDGVLAFGESLAERYRKLGWGGRVAVWHEAADADLFRPMPEIERERDLVWVGNWGDGERADELNEFLVEPARRLGLDGTVRGVRYPPSALESLERAGLEYGGYVANAQAPRLFAAHRVTIHVPRRPYVEALAGIPTIRVFEALACGIPLISAPWDDCEGLFRRGQDFLVARNGAEMTARLREVLNDRDYAEALAARGLETLRARHTCDHRASELTGIVARFSGERRVVELEAAP